MRCRTLLWSALLAAPAFAADVSVTFKDPSGDDNGPGTYTYPTDVVYKKGSFDLTEVKVAKKGDKVDFTVAVGANLEDPWAMKAGFCVQMIFVFVDTDGDPKNGFTTAPPGLNVKFAPGQGWDRLVILSPQAPARVKQEVETRAASMKAAVVIPQRTRGSGRKISASVDASALGAGDPTTWRYQVVMQGNEGFPSGTDLLTRRVNEFEGQHRFGGGHDLDCDPHVIDLLAGAASGDPKEVEAQRRMLVYECSDDPSKANLASLSLVAPPK